MSNLYQIVSKRNRGEPSRQQQRRSSGDDEGDSSMDEATPDTSIVAGGEDASPLPLTTTRRVTSMGSWSQGNISGAGTTSDVSGLTMDVALHPVAPNRPEPEEQEDVSVGDESTTIHSNSTHNRLSRGGYYSASSLSTSSLERTPVASIPAFPVAASPTDEAEGTNLRALRERSNRDLSVVESVSSSPDDELEEAMQVERMLLEAHKAMGSSVHSVDSSSNVDDSLDQATTQVRRRRQPQAAVAPAQLMDDSEHVSYSSSEGSTVNEDDFADLSYHQPAPRRIFESSGSSESTVNEDDYANLSFQNHRRQRYGSASAPPAGTVSGTMSQYDGTYDAPDVSSHVSEATSTRRDGFGVRSATGSAAVNDDGDAPLLDADFHVMGAGRNDVLGEPGAAGRASSIKSRRQKYRRFQLLLTVAIVVALIALVALLVLFLTGRPSTSNPETTSSPSVAVPTSTPTVTLPPALLTGISTSEELQELLAAESFDGGGAMRTPGTAQNSALRWLEDDPKLPSRTHANLIQRYALAVFYYATNGDEWSATRQPFLSYDDDVCDWYSSNEENATLCVTDGVNVDHLELKSASLRGSIPPEVALLLLDSLILDENFLSGALPTELFGSNTADIFSVSVNKLASTIPTEIGLAGTTLSYVDFSSNMLTGRIPSELGLLSTDGTIIWLVDNDFTGTIPSELANFVGVASWNFYDLDGLEGTMPPELCEFVREEPLTRELTVGCNSNVVCDCCTDDCSDDLEALLTSVSFDDGAAMQTAGTPQNVAFQWMQGDPYLSLRNETDLVQRYALAVLYYSTDGDSWNIGQQTFLSYEDDVCDWYSTEDEVSICNDEGEVDILSLTSSKLDGSIPPEIGLLTQLLAIVTSHNNLRGPLPEELFTNLLALKYFNVYDNLLTSTIPSSIGLLTGLEYVDLDTNLLVGKIATEIGLLTDMRLLWLSSNKFSGTVPTELAKCVNMEGLYLFDNGGLNGTVSDDFCALRFNGVLEELQVGCESNVQCDCCTDKCDQETDEQQEDADKKDIFRTPRPTPVVGPTSAPVPQQPPVDLGELLTRVSFDDGAQMRTAGTPQNQAFEWLQGDPNVSLRSEIDLVQRYALSVLYFATNGDSWTREGPFLSYEDDVCDWYTTEQNVSVCNDEGVKDILALTNLTLDGVTPPEIGLMSNLLALVLYRNELKGPLPDELFTSLTRLDFFSVYANELTSTIPSTVGLLTNLFFADFDANMFEGEIPTEFGLLTALENLWLASNNFTGTIPNELSNCTRLRELFLFGNDGLTGRIPEEVCILREDGNLEKLEVGCESNIECDCCTDKCDPGGKYDYEEEDTASQAPSIPDTHSQVPSSSDAPSQALSSSDAPSLAPSHLDATSQEPSTSCSNTSCRSGSHAD